jgi:hypothetical protein
MHRAVGEAIEHRYGDAPEQLAALAHHFAEAAPLGDADRALGYATKAGHEAMRLFAYEQAIEMFELALGMDDLLPQHNERRARLLLWLGFAQARVDHMAAKETLVAAAERAREVPEPTLFTEAGLPSAPARSASG